MTDREWLDKFEADFAKLQHNREKVPLERLQTEYARPYNALVEELKKDADWFADKWLEALTFPTHPKDEAGNEWLFKKMAAILKEENQPGRLRDQWQSALIDKLDRPAFDDLVNRRYERLLNEAFDPYWQRHCRWAGEAGNRWIYNDIFKKWWWPPHDDRKLGGHVGGLWINSDYTGFDCRYPPNIGPDPLTQQEGATA